MGFEKKVAPGQVIDSSPLERASFVNDVIDCVNNYKLTQQQGFPSGNQGAFRMANIVKVKNQTGSAMLAGDVIQLGGSMLSPVDPNNPWIYGNSMADPAISRYAVLLQPAAPNDIVYAQASGTCLAKINVANSNDTFAMPVAGQTYFQSGPVGPVEILTGLGSSGTCLAWVRMPVGISRAILIPNGDTAITGQPSTLGYYDCIVSSALGSGLSGTQKVWLYMPDIGSGAYGTPPSSGQTCWPVAPFFFFNGEQVQADLVGTYDPYPGGDGGTSDLRPLYNTMAKACGLGVRTAITTAGWVKNPGGIPYLPCKIYSAGSVPFRVYCPWGAGGTNLRMPSAGSAGLDVQYTQLNSMYAGGGSIYPGWVAQAIGDYLDEPIGAVRMHATSFGADGWKFMDGSANATSAGGSGISMSQVIPRGGYNAAIGLGAAFGSDDVDLSTLIADHTSHYHNYTPYVAETGAEPGGSLSCAGYLTSPQETTVDTGLEGGSFPPAGTNHQRHFVPGTSGQLASGANIPACMTLAFFERVDNSQTSVI